MKTCRSMPVIHPSACCMPRQMPAYASSTFMVSFLMASSAHLITPFVNAFNATTTAFSSPCLGASSTASVWGGQQAQSARPSGTFHWGGGGKAAATVPGLSREPAAPPAPWSEGALSGNLNKRRTWTITFDGNSTGNAATHASRPGVCSSFSPKLRRCVLHTSAKSRAASCRTPGSLCASPSLSRSHSPGLKVPGCTTIFFGYSFTKSRSAAMRQSHPAIAPLPPLPAVGDGGAPGSASLCGTRCRRINAAMAMGVTMSPTGGRSSLKIACVVCVRTASFESPMRAQSWRSSGAKCATKSRPSTALQKAGTVAATALQASA
mmetsp:Transcript_71900/g.199533  ORF Transcript_71900/g.199533 Transcript_71900/m.199533 type:complete len:321 (-) Transcript_71900:1332-2294(-)